MHLLGLGFLGVGSVGQISSLVVGDLVIATNAVGMSRCKWYNSWGVAFQSNVYVEYIVAAGGERVPRINCGTVP